MKVIKILAIIGVVLALALGGLGTVLATDPPATPPATPTPKPARPLNIMGTIASITPEDLSAPEHVITLNTKRGTVEVVANADTRYQVPGVIGASLADFAAGDAVTVMAVKQEERLIAKAVIKVPAQGLLKQIREHVIAGKVASIEDAIITLETFQGEVQVITNADTRYNVPGVKEAGLDDIKVGDQVTVKGQKTDAGFVAKLVMVLPKPGFALHLAGQVSQVSDTTITVTDKDGNTFTIDIPQGVAGVEPGQWVNVVIDDRPPAPKLGQLKNQVRKFAERWPGPQFGPGTAPWEGLQGRGLNAHPGLHGAAPWGRPFNRP